jgi:hypothetical protein
MTADEFLDDLYRHEGIYSTAELAQMMVAMQNMVIPDGKTFTPEIIDQVFKAADVDRLLPIVLVAMLRTSFALRQGIREWVPFRDRVRASLDERAFKTESLLRGL